MSGTWRDTLFIWSGPLHLENEGNASQWSVRWSGSWIGCEDSPDPSSAELPTPSAFGESDMKFDVSGQLKKAGDFYSLTLTDGEWDLQDGDDGAKNQYGDEKHSVLLPSIDRNDLKGITKPIVAVGENAFGAFISAGFITAKAKCSPALHITLARRYLDVGDTRANWKVRQLYTKILERGEAELPWKSDDLHAETRTGKRKRKAPSR